MECGLVRNRLEGVDTNLFFLLNDKFITVFHTFTTFSKIPYPVAQVYARALRRFRKVNNRRTAAKYKILGIHK